MMPTVSDVGGWRYDISNAPHDEPIIAAGNEGVVTVSRWNDKRQAWSMFTTATPPLAWMPWPKHPNTGVTK
jgi:hypothetical protein